MKELNVIKNELEAFEKNIMQESEQRMVQENVLKGKIERLKEEQEIYKYDKAVYDEYTKSIQQVEEEISKLESMNTMDAKKEIKSKINEKKDEAIKKVTALRIEKEKLIADKELEISKKEIEAQEILQKAGTEEAMLEKELSDGTKVKVPRILETYKELDKLKDELKQFENDKEDCQKYIDELKGIEEKVETRQLEPEEIRFFHGQGDLPKDIKENVAANNEYFEIGEAGEAKKVKVEKEKIELNQPSIKSQIKPQSQPQSQPQQEHKPQSQTQTKTEKKQEPKMYIDFYAKDQKYKLIYQEGVKVISKDISLKDIVSDDKYKGFVERLQEKATESQLKEIDPYIAYIIAQTEMSDKFNDYIKATLNKDSKLDSIGIKYNMNGIYGRKYSSEMSSDIMNYANTYEEKGIATVQKGRFTRFLESHSGIRNVWEKVTKIGNKKELLLPPSTQTKEVKDSNDKKDSKKIVPEYSITVMKVLESKTMEELKQKLEKIDRDSLTKDERDAISERWTNLRNQENMKSEDKDEKEKIDEPTK